jgi:hypothetical protein
LVNEEVLVRKKGLIFKTGLLVFIGLLMYAGIRMGIRYILIPKGYIALYILKVIMNPLFFTAFLAILFLVPRSSYFRNLVLLIIMLILTIPIIIISYKTAIYDPLSFNKYNYIHYQEITYPFKAFSGEIQYSPNMHLATSKNVWASSITKNIDELMCLFNVYFDAGAKRASFIFTDDLDQLISEAMDRDFNYILITTDEWDHLVSESALAADLQGRYRILTEDQGEVVLLARK